MPSRLGMRTSISTTSGCNPLAARDQLALALFDWIETWYNPQRRHSYTNGLSPTDYEAAHAA